MSQKRGFLFLVASMYECEPGSDRQRTANDEVFLLCKTTDLILIAHCNIHRSNTKMLDLHEYKSSDFLRAPQHYTLTEEALLSGLEKRGQSVGKVGSCLGGVWKVLFVFSVLETCAVSSEKEWFHSTHY